MLSGDTYNTAYLGFREKIRRARIDAGLSQVQLADILGKPQSFVSKVESGERRLDFVEVQVLCRVLEKPLSYFQDESLA